MVDSTSVNGTTTVERALELPELLHLQSSDAQRVPSPGTLRALKAETGKSFDDLMGPDADPADRFQTIIWQRLRRDHPGLRWDDCADVELQIDDAAAPPNPTMLSDSERSPDSVGSGG